MNARNAWALLLLAGALLLPGVVHVPDRVAPPATATGPVHLPVAAERLGLPAPEPPGPAIAAVMPAGHDHDPGDVPGEGDLIEWASRLIQSGHGAASVQPLREHLESEFQDVDAWIMLGRAYRESDDLAAAVRSYHEALRFATGETGNHIVQSQINLLISIQIERAREQGTLEESVALLQELLRSPPYMAGYHIRLATLYDLLTRRDEAISTLYYVYNDPEFGDTARQMLKQLRPGT